MVRSYESAIRREQADKTRLALLDACEALMLEGPVEEVTLPKIAKRAGVTAPTAYRHFPDHDALMRAFMDHLRHRVGMSLTAIAAVPPESVHAIPLVNYASYERDARLLRALMMSPAYERVRLSRPVDRAGMALHAWAGHRGGIDDARLREMIASVYLMVTPAAWRWLRDTWGLDAEAAARAASWATRALADAIAAEGARAPSVNERGATARAAPGREGALQPGTTRSKGSRGGEPKARNASKARRTGGKKEAR